MIDVVPQVSAVEVSKEIGVLKKGFQLLESELELQKTSPAVEGDSFGVTAYFETKNVNSCHD